MCLWLYSIGNTLKVYILERHTDTPTITDMEGLLYRYLVRRTSGAEDREVYAWLEASEKNRSLFFEVAAVWSAHRTLISPATGERCDAMLRMTAEMPRHKRPTLWISRSDPQRC